MIETVYNTEKNTHEEISWEKVDGNHHEYICSSNHEVHQVFQTNHGVLVRYLGDSFSMLIPCELVPEDENEAKNIIHKHF